MQVIICESAGDWAAELCRRLPANVSLIETRSLDDLLRQLDQMPAAVVALELTASQGKQVVTAVHRIDREFPRATTIVLAARDLSPWEGLVREAGAIHFVGSPRKVDEIVELVRRRAALASEHGAAAADSNSLEDQILAGLPWGE
jgi:response regulator RpfG family c-di-GMP phosphodiesterase